MPLAEDKQIDLGLVGEGDAQIVADEMGLKTLVKNLVEDTIRHTLRGGCVDLSLRTTSTQVILQIDDTGAGIPENQRQRVFDPFYRLLSHVQEGSGWVCQSWRQLLRAIEPISGLKVGSPIPGSGCV